MRFHIVLIFLLSSGLAHGLEGWEEIVFRDGKTKEGSLKILVEEGRNFDGEIVIRVKNQYDVPLTYHGYGERSPQVFFKRKVGEEWKPKGWHWCGTGMEAFTLLPGKNVEFKFSPSRKGEESLFYTIFRKSGGEKEGYLTLLNPSAKKNG